MWKPILAATVALMIAGPSLGLAQSGPAAPDGAGPAARAQGPRMRMTAEDIQALTDARIAGLKAGLRLTPEQEKNWPPVESAIRDLAKERTDRFNAHRARLEQPGQQRDAIEVLRERADAMGARAASLKKLADAAEPLYRSLDDGQKQRLALLARPALRPYGAGQFHGRRGFGPSGRSVPAQ
jgi:zinc resistance-associated protein